VLLKNLRYTFRKLMRSPGFTLIVAGSLALGIGANAAIFSFADAVLLRPLPIAQPSAVLTVRSWDETRTSSMGDGGVSFRDYIDFRDRSRSFDQLLAYDMITASLASQPGSAPHFTYAMLVTGNFFKLLGVEPRLGRDFRPDEDQAPGRNPVAMLSYGAWVNEWHKDPKILGRTLRLNGLSLTIVGVAPESFWGMDLYIRPSVFVPLMMAPPLLGDEGQRLIDRRDARVLNVKGRLRQGKAIAAAKAELDGIGRDLERNYPDTNRFERATVRTELENRFDSSPADVAVLAIAFVLAILVLMISCANVANLLIGRSAARGKEITLRLALGASRFHLVRQLLTENLLLALLGGLFGLILAAVAARFFSSWPIPTDLPMVVDVRLDRRVLLFSLAVLLLSVVGFGLVPAIQATRADLISALRGREGGGGKRASRSSRVLVVVQVALSLFLLTSAAGLSKGLEKLTRARAGFRTRGILLATFDPTVLRYTPERARLFYRRLVDGARTIPGVRSAALASAVPLGNGADSLKLVPEGYNSPSGARGVPVSGSVVDANYFAVLEVPILRGRAFTEADRGSSRPVVIVNDEFVRRYWPGQDAIGKRVGLGDAQGPSAEVVGVAKSHVYGWVGESPRAYAYRPMEQVTPRPMTLLMESAGNPAALAGPLRELLRFVDSNMPIYDVRTMDDLYKMRAVREPGIMVTSAGSLALLGLVLALVGLYGVMSHSVAVRTREIGIRMALGANPRQVLWMFLRQSVGLALGGAILGVVIGEAASPALGAVVYGATTADALAFAAIPVALLLIVAIATWIPARRAAHVDPVSALRAE
jgi:macrolide transport system ATP-binding/permease protein